MPCFDDFICASGLCQFGECFPCSTDGNCKPDELCIGGGFCAQGEQSLGSSCQDPAMCQSAFCVDGVCCDEPCVGICQGCNFTYTGQANGTCAPIIAGYDPQNECAGTASCNGAGACE